VLEAIARDALGDQDAADRALERALGLAEPDGFLLPFLLHPTKDPLERQARHRTAHAALVAEIRGMPAGPRGHRETAGDMGAGASMPENLVPP
jgi:LuxR family transcriptional regulator, maltose regulon positive regulatory protein